MVRNSLLRIVNIILAGEEEESDDQCKHYVSHIIFFKLLFWIFFKIIVKIFR